MCAAWRKMTIIKIIDTFAFYGFDVALLAFLTAFAVQILKVTLFKKRKKKLLTFLPFIIGTLFYAAYYALKNLCLYCLVKDYISVLEHGFAVGSAATLAYVLYEQFVREKDTLSETQHVVATLIEGFVPADSIDKVAKAVCEAIERDVTGDGARRAQEIISEYAGEDITERDIALLAKLIIETLAHINIQP